MRYNVIKLSLGYVLLFLVGSYSIMYGGTNSASITAQQGADKTALSAKKVPTYQATYTKAHDLLHTKLAISFDWKKQCLQGIATLQLQPHYYPQQYLVLDAKNLAINSLVRIVGDEKATLSYEYDGNKLTIDLGKSFGRGETYWVEITYTTQSSAIQKSEEAILFNHRGLCFIHPEDRDATKPQQVWPLGQPQSNAYWFPTIDTPNQKCTQEIYITVDDKFKTLSNGILGYTTLNADHTRTDYWHLDLPHSPYLFMLVIGAFAEVQDDWNGIEVSYYVKPSYGPYAKAILGSTPEMLEFFSQKLDYPYPWPRYSQVIVKDYVATGMVNTAAAAFTEALQVDKPTFLAKHYENIIAHELCHHWFGNLVTCASWAYLPLNESFACLGEHLWCTHKYGTEEGDLSIWNTCNAYLKEAQHKPVSLMPSYYDEAKDLFDSHLHDKGTLVLHMLKNYLGEAAFYESLSYYLKKHAFSSVETHQLRKAFEEITGEDLNWFFNQWFFTAGHPILQVAHTYEGEKLTLKVAQKQVVKDIACYKLPLTVAIWVGGVQQRHQVIVEDAYHEFTWTLPQQPELVSIDQRSMLVGVIEHPKSIEEYRYLYYHGDHFFAKKEALTYFVTEASNPVYRKVLLDALQDDFWFFRAMAVTAFKKYQGKDFSLVEAQLIARSKEDPNITVRKAALQTLTSLKNPEKYVPIYQEALKEPSYALVSTALYAYATTSNDPTKGAYLAKFEAYEVPEIIAVLGNYYIATKQAKKYSWFKEKITKLQGNPYVCELIPILGKYLAVISDKKTQEAGLALLSNIAQQTNRLDIKRAVCKALQPMHKIKGAKKVQHKIEADR